jgi:hypothetical protein
VAARLDAPVLGADSGYSGPDKWWISSTWRYQRSDRHFTGSHEEPERQEEGSEVINNINIAELGIRWNFAPRWSLSAGIPYFMATRSSVLRHSETREIFDRFKTQARGLGDITVVARRQMFDPAASQGNVSVGLGLKLPTGANNVTDARPIVTEGTDTRNEIRTVDQSIQPGDGGFGIIADLQGFRRIAGGRAAVYGAGTYLATPQEDNGVLTYRGGAGEEIMSIADQYLARLGLSYFPGKGFSASLGGRVEGVRVEDLFGGSEAFRRPGYAVSVEPAVSYTTGPHSFSVAVPIAAHRNRQKSVPDQQNPPRHGDAAFADYVLFLGYFRRI